MENIQNESDNPPVNGGRRKRSQLQEHQRRVTLQDVARAAGVNVSTVSDALKGTGRVAAATREKVQRIAAEHNYVPNLAARALVTGRTGTIGIVTAALNEYYYANVVHLLEKQLAQKNYKVLLLRSRREVHDLVTAAEASAVDGVIAVDMYHVVDEFLRAGNKPIQPCVFVGTFSPEFVDHVTIDLSEAVTEALGIMLAANRQRIAYLVTSDFMAADSEMRAHSYRLTMEAAGRRPEIINLRADIHHVRESFKEFIQEHGCPDGLLCQNDETVMSAYRALTELGYSVPNDVLLVGCDGMYYLDYFETPISTIVQPIEEVCEQAWQFLQRRISNADLPLQSARVKAHLKVTESLRSA